MLPSEFEMASCDGPDLSFSTSNSADEDATAVPSTSVHHKPELPESVKNSKKSLHHSSSDSQLFQFSNKPNRRYSTYSDRLMMSKKNGQIRVPRRSRNIHRHFTDIKSIAVQPPDATQDDVSKARIKLQSKIPTVKV